MRTPRLLNPQDQQLSNHALEAAQRSTIDDRTHAHQAVERLADLSDRLDRLCVYQAHLVIYVLGCGSYARDDGSVRRLADTLAAIHGRHQAIVNERKPAS